MSFKNKAVPRQCHSSFLLLFLLLLFQEKDLHSGLIGPLIICQASVIRTTHIRQLAIQEFSLLFTIFDETKSWYFAENFEKSCPSPCHIQMDDPVLKNNHTFYGKEGPPSPFFPAYLPRLPKKCLGKPH